MRYIIGLLLFFTLSACDHADPKKKFPLVDKDSEIYKISFAMLREDAPEYVRVLDKSEIFAFRIFGEKVECIYFLDSTRLTIHVNVPLYCFDQKTGDFVEKL